ncbi:ABC transporter ATP-binding protein [Thermosipho melanesiensis]|uniref:ABC transporter related n=2 Tax=Thermosipho melanesiensis TaxID=46541 RepID=A6LKL8_THEM4|nr:ABC transporter ATP-binding protein [Thermosipho melanesiensis]ABR30469.1 ABC transporter related [Thermosipho melanesiensis BI429]APT73627.1 ABC transporter ATP-binding protein [Thermosipho melanesiensis]OOC37576.1 ABC transporter ATP-binding protein [Thermosipho melanesiensis]OOC39472.1 ABC transporter ATP-binding protein [Thermosipho melanesiensis]OOC39535.1 ABC transporter ATP-binding protein [Thermosipho melanesiensis]
MLELKDLSYYVSGKKILDNVSMSFNVGKKYAILGTNGAGKSTVGYLIMGLEDYKPTYGRVYFNGEDITEKTVYERSKLGITLMWQEPARYEGLTVTNYLTLGGKLDITRSEIEDALEKVGLDPKLYMNRFVDRSLSGGERKRIELASIILLRPKYVVLDEPDSGIDIMSLDMINSIINYIASYGGTPIVITHREEMAYNTEEAYLLCAGKVLVNGETNKVIEIFKNICNTCDHPNVPVSKELKIDGR